MKTRTIKPKIEKKFNSSKDKLRLEAVNKKDHFMYGVLYENKKIGILQISHTSREFGKGLIGKMARQLGITSSQFRGIEKCNFWGKDFIEHSRLLD